MTQYIFCHHSCQFKQRCIKDSFFDGSKCETYQKIIKEEQKKICNLEQIIFEMEENI